MGKYNELLIHGNKMYIAKYFCSIELKIKKSLIQTQFQITR